MICAVFWAILLLCVLVVLLVYAATVIRIISSFVAMSIISWGLDCARLCVWHRVCVCTHNAPGESKDILHDLPLITGLTL